MGKIIQFPLNDYFVEWKYDDYYKDEEYFVFGDHGECEYGECNDGIVDNLFGKIIRIIRNLFS